MAIVTVCRAKFGICELVKEKEYQKPKQYQTKQPAKPRIVIEK